MQSNKWWLEDNKSQPSRMTPQSSSKWWLQEESNNEEKLGWPGVGQDILQKGRNIAAAIPSFLKETPGELKGAYRQIKEKPGRAGLNLLAGVGEDIIGILNKPHEAIQYLGKKQITPEWLTKYNELPFTHIPGLGVEEKLGLNEKESGDTALRLLSGLIGGGITKKLLGPRSLNSLENELSKNKNVIARTEAEHKSYLGEGQEHGARASQRFLDYIEGKVNPETGKTEGGYRREVGSKYEQLSQDMSNERVQIEQTPDMKAIQKEISKLGNAASGKEKEKLLKILATDSKLKTVNGADALTAYRELKRQKSKASERAFEPGIGPKEHDEWIAKSEQLGDLEKRMKTMLENQIGGKYLERLKAIDKEYSTQIAPLSENSMYQEMRKHGRTSKNIMQYLHGTTRGNKTLNTIVEKDPELQRVIVGERFAENPSKMAKNPEVLNRYQKLNPLISKMVGEQRHAQNLKESLPELEKSVKEAQQKKIHKQGVGKGIGIAGGGLLLSSLLGEDLKKDIPVAAGIKTVLNNRK